MRTIFISMIALLTAIAAAAQVVQAGTYVVSIREEAAVDRLGVIAEQLARTYGGTVLHVDALRSTIEMQLSGSGASLAGRDPRVASLSRMHVESDSEIVDWRNGVGYAYDGAGNVTTIGNDRFFYDVASRLVSANVNGTTRTYEYDSYGNRTKCTQSSTDCQGHTITSSSNRIAGTNVYDDAGNVKSLDGHTYTWDALNIQTRDDDTGNGVSREYVYTADDERIAVYTVNQWWRWTIRDVSGKVLREYMSEDGTDGKGTANWKWVKDYVWRDGVLLATRQVSPGASTAATWHYHVDHLGTPRRITNDSDQIVGFHDYYAFGPEAGSGKTEPSLSLFKYTGHERDIVDSSVSPPLDYMHARYYSGDMGHFLSIDPFLSKVAIRAPQLWNRYSYAANNPFRYTDPSGKLLQLSGCVENQGSPACHQQYDLLLSSFGKQAQAAAKYLQIGKNGIISFNGISGRGFAAQFGLMGRAANFIISNRAATFSVEIMHLSGGGPKGKSFFETNEERGMGGPGGRIVMDPSKFPTPLGTVSVSLAEAFAHEFGHALGTLIPGIRDDLNKRLGTWVDTQNEGYAMAFENRWRVQVLGVEPNDLRMYYASPGDTLAPSAGTSLFPEP